MGVLTIFKCDKCGHEQADPTVPKEMVELNLSAQVFHANKYKTGVGLNLLKAPVVWCRSCCEAAGLIKVAGSVIEPPTLQTMLEDYIQDIVADSIANSRG